MKFHFRNFIITPTAKYNCWHLLDLSTTTWQARRTILTQYSEHNFRQCCRITFYEGCIREMFSKTTQGIDNCKPCARLFLCILTVKILLTVIFFSFINNITSVSSEVIYMLNGSVTCLSNNVIATDQEVLGSIDSWFRWRIFSNRELFHDMYGTHWMSRSLIYVLFCTVFGL